LLACRAADRTSRVGDTFVNESMTDSAFTGRIVVDTLVGDIPAVITEISGRGAVTGMHQFVVDSADPLRDGFRLR
jgi:proline racemase